MQYQDSLSEFNRESAICSFYEGIKAGLHKSLSSDLNDLWVSLRILNRLYHWYLCGDDSVYLSVLKPLNIKKHTISSLIDDLLSVISVSNVGMFAQAFYLCASSSSILCEQDRLLFSFSTIPSIFKYFITLESQKCFLQFIYIIFEMQHSLHGYSFSFQHMFLKQTVLSYILTYDIVGFLKSAYTMSYPFFADDLYREQYIYISSGNGVSRAVYDLKLTEFAQMFIQQMEYSMPLIPMPIRRLFKAIRKLDDEQSVFSIYILFDCLVCCPMASFDLFPNSICPMLVSDLIMKLRNNYQKGILYPSIKKFVDSISQLIVEFLPDEESFNGGLQHFEPASYFSLKEISLISKCIKCFISHSQGVMDEKVIAFLNSYDRCSDIMNDDQSKFLKVIQYGRHKSVADWHKSIIPIKNQQKYSIAIASLRLDEIDLNQASIENVFELLSYQWENDSILSNMEKDSIFRISKMAKNNREKFEELSFLFVETQNYLSRIILYNRSQVDSLREKILSKFSVNEICNHLAKMKLMSLPPQYEQICERIRLYCVEKDIEKYTNSLQQMVMIRALSLSASSSTFFACKSPAIRFRPNKKWKSREMYSSYLFCSLQYCICFENMFYNLSRAMTLSSTRLIDKVQELLTHVSIDLLSEIQSFLSLYFHNKPKILYYFPKEQTESISIFIQAVQSQKNSTNL